MVLEEALPKESGKKETLILASALATMSSRLELEQLKAYWSMLYTARSDLRAEPAQRDFYLSLKDLCTLSGLSGKNPQRLRANIKAMIKAEVSFDFFNKDGDEEWSETGLVAGAELRKIDDKWVIKYSFSHVIIDRILKPTIYATLGMGSIAGIKKSKYAVVLYGLCADYISLSNPHIAPPVMSVERFRAFLRLEDQYPNFADVKRFVIEPAIAEINKETELDITCTYILEGRRVKSVKFKATHKDKQKLLTTNEVGRFGEIMGHIPRQYHNTLKQLVADKLAGDGYDYCLSNIKYAIKTTNGENPEALIGLALRGDYAKSTREKQAKEQINKEKSEQNKLKDKLKRENEAEAERKAREQQEIIEIEALKLYNSKPETERTEIDKELSGFLIGTTARKIAMYFMDKGELQ